VNRREFIAVLGGAAAWPLAARAQQPGKLPIIGFFSAGSFSAGSAAPLRNWLAALVQRLNQLGWVEGRTVAIEYRWAHGNNERLAEIAAEFVRLKVDVIVTHSAGPVIAAKQATQQPGSAGGQGGDVDGSDRVHDRGRPDQIGSCCQLEPAWRERDVEATGAATRTCSRYHHNRGTGEWPGPSQS
jgi:hypothetical protein